VLISFGGIRRLDFVQQLLSHLSPVFPKWRFHVVLPKGSGASISRKNVRVYFALSAAKMRSLMLRSDVAISGGGQTTNELSACGLPTIGICFAENQRLNIQGWQKHGFLTYVGRSSKPSILNSIAKKLRHFDFQQRCRMGRIGQSLVDGKGAWRVVKFIAKEGRLTHV
jgi:spore coat polysaccharide biosynthesis predicted glycosyltransferase SpsG